MAAEENLFRSEALVAQRQASWGRILINVPLAYWVIAVVAAAAVAALLSVVVLAHYTPRVQANGMLVASSNGGMTLIAQLWVPARTIATIRPGQKVTLRYEAYPWRNVQQLGTVENIDPVPVADRDLSAVTVPSGVMGYRVLVRLPTTSSVHGNHPLTSGVAVQGQILLGRRRLLAALVEGNAASQHPAHVSP